MCRFVVMGVVYGLMGEGYVYGCGLGHCVGLRIRGMCRVECKGIL